MMDLVAERNISFIPSRELEEAISGFRVRKGLPAMQGYIAPAYNPNSGGSGPLGGAPIAPLDMGNMGYVP